MITAGCERLGIEFEFKHPWAERSAPRWRQQSATPAVWVRLHCGEWEMLTSRQQVRDTRVYLAKPFAVNLNLEFPQEERLDACLQEGVPVISFFWREPSALVARAKSGGAIVLHTVSTAAEARQAVDCGVDVVIAQGWEAGGHVRGKVATMPLIPAVVDAVGPVPVIAAGGIADGRGLAAALALGASGAGPEPVFLRAMRWRFTRTIASDFCGQQKTTPLIGKNCSTSAGPRHLIAYCATVLLLVGKPPAVPRRASGLVRARLSLHRNLVGRLCAIDLTPPPPTPKVISTHCRSGPGRALPLFTRDNLQRRSCERSIAKLKPSCSGSLDG